MAGATNADAPVRAYGKWIAAFAVTLVAFIVILGGLMVLTHGALNAGWFDAVVKWLTPTVAGTPPSTVTPAAASAPPMAVTPKEFSTITAALIAASASLVAAGAILYGQIQEARSLENFKARLAVDVARRVGAEARRTEQFKMVWARKLDAYYQAKTNSAAIYYDLQGRMISGDYASPDRELVLQKLGAERGRIAELDADFIRRFEIFHQKVINVTHEAVDIAKSTSDPTQRKNRLGEFFNTKAAATIGNPLKDLDAFPTPDVPWEELDAGVDAV